MIGLKKKTLRKTRIVHEATLIPADSPQTRYPERFWHAEVESEVEILEILHPNLETKENHPKKVGKLV